MTLRRPRREHGGSHVAVADELTVAHRALEQHVDRCRRAQVRVEVDLTAEDLGQTQRQLDVLARRVERRRRASCWREKSRPTPPRARTPSERERLRRRWTRQPHPTRSRNTTRSRLSASMLVAKLAKETVECANHPVRLVGAKIAWVEHAGHGFDDRRRQVVADLLPEQALERRVPRHRPPRRSCPPAERNIVARRAPAIGCRLARRKQRQGNEEVRKPESARHGHESLTNSDARHAGSAQSTAAPSTRSKVMLHDGVWPWAVSSVAGRSGWPVTAADEPIDRQSIEKIRAEGLDVRRPRR